MKIKECLILFLFIFIVSFGCKNRIESEVKEVRSQEPSIDSTFLIKKIIKDNWEIYKNFNGAKIEISTEELSELIEKDLKKIKDLIFYNRKGPPIGLKLNPILTKNEFSYSITSVQKDNNYKVLESFIVNFEQEPHKIIKLHEIIGQFLLRNFKNYTTFDIEDPDNLKLMIIYGGFLGAFEKTVLSKSSDEVKKKVQRHYN